MWLPDIRAGTGASPYESLCMIGISGFLLLAVHKTISVNDTLKLLCNA
ncbi:hypothetical protein NTGM5_120041 [Candidatus Nitrotoga sp. M5]|nr:hypothetical protein NTGM5_120041 [Candidatus Nitrotoga sp. M5]